MKLLDHTKIPIHPYPELREVLEIFVTEIEAELAGNLVGIYLVGSLALGGFDLDSDIDFLVVINSELTEINARNLQDIQIKIHAIDCYPAKHLEGSYISISNLNDWRTVGKKTLYYFDNGSTTFEQSVHDNNWHVRWILRERGIVLIGREPETILQPIPLSELVNEMRESILLIERLFKESLNQPLNYWNSQFGQPFAVLTFCRMLQTMHTRTVQSKKAGADWAKQFLQPKWIKLIDQAWNSRKGVRFGVKIGQRAETKLLSETVEFMHYAIALSRSSRDIPSQIIFLNRNQV